MPAERAKVAAGCDDLRHSAFSAPAARSRYSRQPMGSISVDRSEPNDRLDRIDRIECLICCRRGSRDPLQALRKNFDRKVRRTLNFDRRTRRHLPRRQANCRSHYKWLARSFGHASGGVYALGQASISCGKEGRLLDRGNLNGIPDLPSLCVFLCVQRTWPIL